MALVTCDMGVSTDGFVAGPNQSPEDPLGERIESAREQASWTAGEQMSDAERELVTHLTYRVVW